MEKIKLSRYILESNELDFTAKRVWRYLAMKYPAISKKNKRDTLAWRITEEMSAICTDLNLSQDEFFEYLAVLNKFCTGINSVIPLGIKRQHAKTKTR